MVVCDGLKGLPQAIESVRPPAVVQTCVVHLLRASFRYAARQHWDAIAKALKPVYSAPTEAAALERFYEFAETWGGKYPAIVTLWEEAWAEFVPFLNFDPEIRRVICSTNAIWVLYLLGRSRSCSLDRRSNRLALALNAIDPSEVSWIRSAGLAA
jgi:transposase-like protein